jgi:tRNA(Ile)-lysidine synthase
VRIGEGEERDCVVLHNVPEGARLHVRRRRDGDRFHPTWKQRPLKVKDFLRGQKVPLHRRDDVPLVCLGEEVLALYPSQVCKSASVDSGAERPLVLRLRTGEES